MRSVSNRVPGIVALIAALLLMGAAAVAAQTTGTNEDQLDLFGAIHEGTCEAPGSTAAYHVGDFIEIQESEIVGSSDLALTLRAQQTLQADFDDLFGADAPGYVFVVLDNADPQGDPVACGAVGGVRVNGQVVVGLVTSETITDDGELAGVAVFGNTVPSGPTTQPAQTPGQLPVQAYISSDALTPEPTTPAPVTPTPPQASPTPAPSTPVPTHEPTIAPTESPTQAPTEAPTQPPTESPTDAPTEVPTQEPTDPPTEEPTDSPTEIPTEEDDA